jgi:light-harvesting complex 1 alpha chain
MWKVWMLLDPRRALIGIGIFAFAIVLVNHFVQLSTPRYGSWLYPQMAAQAGVKAPVPVPAQK